MGHFQWKKQFKGTEAKRGRQSSRTHILCIIICYVAHLEEWWETRIEKVGLGQVVEGL